MRSQLLKDGSFINIEAIAMATPEFEKPLKEEKGGVATVVQMQKAVGLAILLCDGTKLNLKGEDAYEVLESIKCRRA